MQQSYTSHLVDLRNHGASEWHAEMDYKSLAEDVHRYIESAGLASEQVALVGHSLGAKTAMAYSCMFPNKVSRVVSLDASPVDRGDCPHLNSTSEEMIENAIALGSLTHLTLPEAIKKIKSEVSDPVLQSALLFNLNQDCSLQVNLQAIHDNQQNIYGFPKGFDHTFDGPCLMLNGADSFQREILDDVNFYKHAFPKISADDIVMIKEAGHGLHFEQPAKVRKLIHSFLLTATETVFEGEANIHQTGKAKLAAL